MVGANKRLMGPRSGGQGPLDPSGDEYQQVQEASGTSSNPIKIGGPGHLSQEPTVYKHHLPETGHRVKKQLFQGDDRQVVSSKVPSRQNSPSASKKRPISPKQSDMMPQAQRSRGSTAGNSQYHQNYARQSASKNQAISQSQRSYKAAPGMAGNFSQPMMASSQSCAPQGLP